VIRFYRNALLVLLLALSGLFAAESLVLRLEAPYYDRHRASWLESPKIQTKVVLIGSSTVRYGLSPEIVAETSEYEQSEIVNISGDAYTPMINSHIWKEHADALSNARLVLYGMDPWIFYQHYYRNKDFMRLHWTYRQRIEHVRGSYSSANPDIGLLTGMYSRRVLKRIVEDQWWPRAFMLRGRDNGSSILRRPPRVTTRANTRAFFGDTSRFPLSSIYLERLAEIKERVEAQGGIFVLVFPPKTRAWVESYQNTCAELDRELADAIRSRLGPVRTVGSYRLFSDETSYFVDHVHLRESGRRAFSEFVGRSLAKIPEQRPRELTSLLGNSPS
jgi:hypothetical protein